MTREQYRGATIFRKQVNKIKITFRAKCYIDTNWIVPPRKRYAPSYTLCEWVWGDVQSNTFR